MKNSLKDLKLAIVGLGYVGLPLAIEFGKKRSVIGYDLDKQRILELKKKYDRTGEITSSEFKNSRRLNFTSHASKLKSSNCFIITVPTPIDENNKPNLTQLIEASELIGKIIKYGDIVIYESTVFPGATEEVCVPILEKNSRLKFNEDFFVGYSPERINPGDKKHKLHNICKITSGSSPDAAKLIDSLYKEIISAGTHLAESIKIAEAAKVIENTQRDLNIALINEFSVIFDKLNIETESVLKAAETKWNFISFRPGLVGGHCIGVDPYYLMHKAEDLGYKPKIITSGRKFNDDMYKFVSSKLIKAMSSKNIKVQNSKVLVLGFAFKENTKDFRNTGILKLVNEIKSKKMLVDIYDPLVDREIVKEKLNLTLIDYPKLEYYNAIIIALKHKVFKKISLYDMKNFCKDDHIIFDLKNLFNGKADLNL